MNNKRILKKYPKAVALKFKIRFGMSRPVGTEFFVIAPSPHSKFCIGMGWTEKKAWQFANSVIPNWTHNGQKLTYSIESARLEME